MACNRKYRISNYDDSYEVINEDKTALLVDSITANKNQIQIQNKDLNQNQNENKSNNKPIIDESQGPELEFLSPMFDLSDAPILDFSNSFSSGSSTDPSSLISKVLDDNFFFIFCHIFIILVLFYIYTDCFINFLL